MLECVEGKKEVFKRDLEELESSILNEQREFASRIRNQKANLEKNLEEVKRSIDEQGEKLHKQVSDVVEMFKSEIAKKYEEKFAVMNKTEERIASLIFDISVKELQASRDLGLVFEYKSRNEELRKTPPNLHVTRPTFVAYDITKEKLNELFESLTMASDVRKTLEQDVKSMSLKAKDVERDELDKRKNQKEKNKVYIKYMVYIKRAFLNLFLSHIHLFLCHLT